MKKENDFQHFVSEDEVGQRLDRYLGRLYPVLLKSLLQKALRKGDIRVDGLKKTPDYRVCARECVTLFKGIVPVGAPKKKVQNTAALARLAEQLKPCILYQDAHMLVLNKPSGVACQGGTGVRASLDRALEQVLGRKIFLVHRLDKETTGVLIVAQTRQTAEDLSQLFTARKIKKTYLALVKGATLKEQGVLVSWLKKEPKGACEAMQVSASETPGAVRAETRFIRLATHTDLSLVELHLITGRKHQLRAQMAFLGAPIEGDRLYGNGRARQGLCLHAQRLEMTYRGKAYCFEVPIPVGFRDMLIKNGFSLAPPKDWREQHEDGQEFKSTK